MRFNSIMIAWIREYLGVSFTASFQLTDEHLDPSLCIANECESRPSSLLHPLHALRKQSAALYESLSPASVSSTFVPPSQLWVPSSRRKEHLTSLRKDCRWLRKDRIRLWRGLARELIEYCLWLDEDGLGLVDGLRNRHRKGEGGEGEGDDRDLGKHGGRNFDRFSWEARGVQSEMSLARRNARQARLCCLLGPLTTEISRLAGLVWRFVGCWWVVRRR